MGGGVMRMLSRWTKFHRIWPLACGRARKRRFSSPRPFCYDRVGHNETMAERPSVFSDYSTVTWETLREGWKYIPKRDGAAFRAPGGAPVRKTARAGIADRTDA